VSEGFIPIDMDPNTAWKRRQRLYAPAYARHLQNGHDFYTAHRNALLDVHELMRNDREIGRVPMDDPEGMHPPRHLSDNLDRLYREGRDTMGHPKNTDEWGEEDAGPTKLEMSLYDIQSAAWQSYLAAGGRASPENARRLANDVLQMTHVKGGTEILSDLAARFSLLSGSDSGSPL
jgi:hypothetical protein